MSDDDTAKRREPPKDHHDWGYIWEGAEKGHKSWTIAGPIYAAVTNWKAWLIIIGVVAALNRPEIVEAAKILAGGSK